MSKVEVMKGFSSHTKSALAAAFSVFVLFAGYPSLASAEDDGRPVIKVPRGGGRETFTNNCTTCHMPDGRGGQNEGGYGADLRVTKLTEDEIFISIKEGRQSKGMPSFKGMIDEDNIRLLATFIKEDLRLKK
jgi:mono/diheme cytochrome c family protein